MSNIQSDLNEISMNNNLEINKELPTSVNQKQKKRPRSRDEIISKQLSWILRHGAKQENLPITQDGFIPVGLLLKINKLKSLKVSQLDILRIARNDNKKRYTIRDTTNREIIDNISDSLEKVDIEICANQGHSMKEIEISLEKISKMRTGEQIIHGTSMKNWKLIKESGYLSKMTRNHIHFSIGLLNNNAGINVISGMRENCTVFIYVDFESSKNEKIEFFRSKNNVILSNGVNGKIPLKCFERVINRKGEILL